MIRLLARATPILFTLLIACLTSARPVTDIPRLRELEDEYHRLWQSWQGPAYEEALRDPTPEIAAILADTNATLLGIRPDGTPVIARLGNANAAITTRTIDIIPGGSVNTNLDGSTISGLYIWDSGSVDEDHVEFGGRVTFADEFSQSPGHATHVAGTMIAAGVNPAARGMATAATLISYYMEDDLSEMAAAAADGALVSNHSYSLEGYTGARYGLYPMTHDEFAVAAPYYAMFFCAGNNGLEGYFTVWSSQISKNGFCVGNVDDVLEYSGPESVILNESSSLGPCEDGRIKPDFVANGTEVFSTSPGDQYQSLSGTSMATPNASGTAFLLYEYYNQTHGELPLSSTIKAILVSTARECGPAPGPDYKFGFGLIDANMAVTQISLDTFVDSATIIEDDLLDRDVDSWYFTSLGDQSIAIAIAWLDPPAEMLANPTLINDLDIRLEYLGDRSVTLPWTLNVELPSHPAERGDNVVDNVERVDLANPAPGTYALHVTHKGELAGGIQSYSLSVVGLSSTDTPNYLFTLLPLSAQVPPGGGLVSFDAHFMNNTNQSFNLVFWTTVETVGGYETNPLLVRTFHAPPNFDTHAIFEQMVPAAVPGGYYEYHGHVGPDLDHPVLTDTFQLIKLRREFAPDHLPQDN